MKERNPIFMYTHSSTNNKQAFTCIVMHIATLVLLIMMSFTFMNVAFMESSSEPIDRREAVKIAKNLLTETSLVIGDIEDYVENESLLREDANGNSYWYISFVRPVDSEDEEIINLVVTLSADGSKLIEMASSKRNDFEIMKEFNRLINDRGAFVLWSVEDKHQFIADWSKKVAALPEDTFREGNYLLHLLKTEHILPEHNDLMENDAVTKAKEAMAKAFPEVNISDYKIAKSFILDKADGRIWRIFFIPVDVRVSHPGYSIVIGSPNGSILQVTDLDELNIFSNFGYE
ncbi:MAG: hypothetical protein ACOX7B_09640 [Christensenellales bacterium]